MDYIQRLCLWYQEEVKLCRIIVQALFPPKAGKLQRSSSSETRRALHITEPKAGESFSWASFSVHLSHFPNAWPLWRPCMFRNTCSNKQGTTSIYLMCTRHCIPLSISQIPSAHPSLRFSLHHLFISMASCAFMSILRSICREFCCTGHFGLFCKEEKDGGAVLPGPLENRQSGGG